jgi:hypothetical protein
MNHHDKNKRIKHILVEVFGLDRDKRAAGLLREAGFTSRDLHAFSQLQSSQTIPDPWVWNTYNALREIEHQQEDRS